MPDRFPPVLRFATTLSVIAATVGGCAAARTEPRGCFVCGNAFDAELTRERERELLQENLSELVAAYNKTPEKNCSDPTRREAELEVLDAAHRLKIWTESFGDRFFSTDEHEPATPANR
jgi:hypothetical protein